MLKILLILLVSLSIYAKDEKMILLYVEKDGCQWCQMMDEDIIENTKVLKKINKLYKLKRVKKGSKLIPSFIEVKYYPSSYILSPDSTKLVDEIIGYQNPDKFIEQLQYIYELFGQ